MTQSNSRPPTPPPDDQDEVAHLDDAVIGRAFCWSFVAMGVIAVAAIGVVIALKRKPAPPPPQITKIEAPAAAARRTAEIPTVKFTDITAQSGITYRHINGAAGEKLLPETMGGGVAFFDFNNDDRPDLLFVNSCYWPWDKDAANKPKATLALYRNDGAGKFTDVTAGSGLDVSLYGMSAACGDFDNDGNVDVFISGVGGGRLIRNLGNGKFSDVTSAAGVGGATNDWSTACAWFDYDNDGKLDLLVANYVRWSREIDFEVGYKIDGVHRAYGQPNNFQGAFPHLYHNDGDGKFTEVAAKAGLHIKNPATGVPVAKTLGVAPIDFDGDGWMDLVIANDTVQNFLFHNERNGTFKEIGALAGVAFDVNGAARGAMGIDAARYRDDGALGIAIANFANEMTGLYVCNKDPMLFTDEAIAEGVGPAGRLALKFGIFFFDYDLDGRLDLLTANGHLEEEIGKIQASQKYAQPAQLFWNCGSSNAATFCSVPEAKAGADLFKPIVGRGCAYADIDGDGDLDCVLTQINGPPLLLRNDQQLGHHFLRLKLAGKSANRDGIGAWVSVKAGGRVIARQAMPTRSYLSQSELPITIGLGSNAKVDEVTVTWPGGGRQAVTDARVDGTIAVEQKP